MKVCEKLRLWCIKKLGGVPKPEAVTHIHKIVQTPCHPYRIAFSQVVDYDQYPDKQVVDDYVNQQLSYQLADYIREHDLWDITEDYNTISGVLVRRAELLIEVPEGR